MTFFLVTEIDDIDGSETVRFATANPELAATARAFLEHHGYRAEIREFAPDTLTLDDLEAEERALVA